MKQFLACLILAISLRATEKPIKAANISDRISPVKNLFIITIDGFRWQEVFNGADSVLINDQQCADQETIKLLYWAPTAEERRKKLMPFFWNVLAKKGQVFGNRNLSNKVNASNIYAVSYPGYNEMFTGEVDFAVSSNTKKVNPNLNVLEWLNELPQHRGNVVAFTSWDVFPFILNRGRSGMTMNSGYEDLEASNAMQALVNSVQSKCVYNKTGTRQDELTFIAAKEYIRNFQPSIVYLAFGETDELGHCGRYDLYLEKAAQIDRMLGELWHLVQSTPTYKDNTTFLITTDHGRGKSRAGWSSHGFLVNGSSQTWLALMGPNVTPLGEMKNHEQIYQKQIAQTIANLVGENFPGNDHVAPGIAIK